MSFKKLTIGCAVLGGLLALTMATEAQNDRPDFEIKAIRQQQTDAPQYGTSDLGGHPATLWRTWLKIEVQFETREEWSDDVQVKYYVLMGRQGDERLFVGDVTHINVAKGAQHYSAMFMQPNTLRRYGAGQISAVAVRIFHRGRLEAQLSDPPTLREGWWDRFSPTPGYLLAPKDTPWAPIADERFEAIKPETRQ